MKRLYKSRKDKVIDGVCAGAAEYFDVDPVLVRIVMVFLAFFGGTGVIAYIVGMIIIPRRPYGEETVMDVEPPQAPPPESESKPRESSPRKETQGSLLIGIILVVVGALFLFDNLSIFHRFYFWGWFRRNFWDFFVPAIFIIVGIGLLTKSKGNGKS